MPHGELVSDDPTSPDAVIDLRETLAGHSKRPILDKLLTRHEALALVEGDTFNDCAFTKMPDGDRLSWRTFWRDH